MQLTNHDGQVDEKFLQQGGLRRHDLDARRQAGDQHARVRLERSKLVPGGDTRQNGAVARKRRRSLPLSLPLFLGGVFSES